MTGPSSSPDPRLAIHVAVDRTAPSQVAPNRRSKEEPFLPEQGMELPAAIAGYTMFGSAYANHLEAETGSIEVGKYADLVVLDRNWFDHHISEVGDAQVMMTLVGGKKVFVGSGW